MSINFTTTHHTAEYNVTDHMHATNVYTLALIINLFPDLFMSRRKFM